MFSLKKKITLKIATLSNIMSLKIATFSFYKHNVTKTLKDIFALTFKMILIGMFLSK